MLKDMGTDMALDVGAETLETKFGVDFIKSVLQGLRTSTGIKIDRETDKAQKQANTELDKKVQQQYRNTMAYAGGVAENQGWAATLEAEKKKFVEPEVEKDPQLKQAKLFAKQHYSKFSQDPEEAFDKWVQRALMHSEEEDAKHARLLNNLQQQIQQLKRQLTQPVAQPAVTEYSPEGLRATYQSKTSNDFVEERSRPIKTI